MRPPTHRQSALRAPLNALLGTEANVRILRVLAEEGSSLSASEIAHRAQLGLAGVGSAVAALIDVGIVERVGSGTRSPVRMRPDHPLSRSLTDVFQHERAYFEQIIERLRAAAARIEPIPQSVWIQGSVARGEDRFGDPVVVGVLAGAGAAEQARDGLEVSAEEIEKTFDVTVEVLVRTPADLRAMSPNELDELRVVIPLLGPPPLFLMSKDSGARKRVAERTIRSHAHADARGRALAEAIAGRLKSDPSLVTRARAYIAARLTKASAGERRDLEEWDRVLRTMPVARLRRFLIDPGERATRLRQTLPFLGVLTEEERAAIADRVAAAE
jgi:hypothetical protein